MLRLLRVKTNFYYRSQEMRKQGQKQIRDDKETMSTIYEACGRMRHLPVDCAGGWKILTTILYAKIQRALLSFGQNGLAPLPSTHQGRD